MTNVMQVSKNFWVVYAGNDIIGNVERRSAGVYVAHTTANIALPAYDTLDAAVRALEHFPRT